MLVQITTRLFVFQNMLVNPFMTDPNALLLFQPARDLFRTPILSQQTLHNGPALGGDPRDGFQLRITGHSWACCGR